MPLTPTNRRVQLRVAYAPGFTPQSAVGVPLALSALTKVLTLKDGGQSHITPVYHEEDIDDCTTQYLIDKLVLHRYARLNLDLEVDTEVLGDIIGHTFGQRSGNTCQMLGPTTFELPLTTMVVGFADGSDPGIVFQDVAASTLTITGRVDNKLDVKWSLVGSALMADASAFTFPDCSQITVLRFDTNTSVKIQGVEYVQLTRNLEFQYNNNIPLNDFPWTLGALDVQRMERGNKRPVMLNVTIEGRENNTLGRAAMAVPRTHYSFDIRIGSAIDGVDIVAVDAVLEPNGDLEGFDGEVAISTLNLMLTPTRVPGNAATPVEGLINT